MLTLTLIIDLDDLITVINKTNIFFTHSLSKWGGIFVIFLYVYGNMKMNNLQSELLKKHTS